MFLIVSGMYCWKIGILIVFLKPTSSTYLPKVDHCTPQITLNDYKLM